MSTELNEQRGRADLALQAEAKAREAQLAAEAQSRELDRLVSEMGSELKMVRAAPPRAWQTI
eukprot:5995197-Prymnesium_polylepis.1